MDIAELMDLAASRPTEVSRRSGVSRATIKRIRDGVSQPSIDTLRELALAIGLDVELRVKAASDPNAAVAARVLLEQAMAKAPIRAEVDDWMRRFERYGLEEPRAIAKEAGRMSAPAASESSAFFAPRSGIEGERLVRTVASAAAATGSAYAVSGAAAAAELLGREVNGPVVLWTEQVESVAEMLGQTLIRASRFQPAGTVVARAPSETFTDSASIAGMKFAAPIQVVIDLYGLGLDAIADEISGEW